MEKKSAEGKECIIVSVNIDLLILTFLFFCIPFLFFCIPFLFLFPFFYAATITLNVGKIHIILKMVYWDRSCYSCMVWVYPCCLFGSYDILHNLIIKKEKKENRKRQRQRSRKRKKEFPFSKKMVVVNLVI